MSCGCTKTPSSVHKGGGNPFNLHAPIPLFCFFFFFSMDSPQWTRMTTDLIMVPHLPPVYMNYIVTYTQCAHNVSDWLFIFISRESKWGTLKSAVNPRCAVPAESHSICTDRRQPGSAAALQVSPTSDTCQSVAILMNRPHCVKKTQNCMVWRTGSSSLVFYLIEHRCCGCLCQLLCVALPPSLVVWAMWQVVGGESMTVCICHRSHHFATQCSHFVDRAGCTWQAQMASIKFWIQLYVMHTTPIHMQVWWKMRTIVQN